MKYDMPDLILSPEQWDEFKQEMNKKEIPFDKKKRNVIQQMTWDMSITDIMDHGSIANAREYHKKYTKLENALEAAKRRIFTDWTEEYGRKVTAGDKVLMYDSGWLLYDALRDKDKFIANNLQVLLVKEVHQKRIYTSEPSCRSGRWYIKSGKNCWEPKGQARLVIPDPSFDMSDSKVKQKINNCSQHVRGPV